MCSCGVRSSKGLRSRRTAQRRASLGQLVFAALECSRLSLARVKAKVCRELFGLSEQRYITHLCYDDHGRIETDARYAAKQLLILVEAGFLLHQRLYLALNAPYSRQQHVQNRPPAKHGARGNTAYVGEHLTVSGENLVELSRQPVFEARNIVHKFAALTCQQPHAAQGARGYLRRPQNLEPVQHCDSIPWSFSSASFMLVMSW